MARHKKTKTLKFLLPFIILLILLGGGFLTFNWFFQSHTEITVEEIKPVATLQIEEGKVDIKLVDTQTWNRANNGMTLFTGDSIRTQSGAFASIEFFDKSVVRLDGNSQLTLINLQKDEISDIVELDLEEGRLWARVMKILDENSKFEISTPTAEASVKGTAFELIVEKVIAINPDTGEEEEIIQTNIKVIESEVGFRAIAKVTSTDETGNPQTQTTVLASVVLPAGSQSSIDQNDIKQFSQESGAKPIVRGLSPDDKAEDWIQLNSQLDLLHLQDVEAELQLILDDIEAQGLIDKLLQSKTERARNNATKAIFTQIQKQLSELQATSQNSNQNQNQEQNQSGQSNESDDSQSQNQEQEQKQTQDRQHIVQSGDTLSAIAARYGTTVEVLMRANGISDPTLLQVGAELIIPSDTSNLPPLVVAPGGHTSNGSSSGQNQESEQEQNQGDDSQNQNQNQSGQQPDTNVQDDEPFISAQ